MSMSTQTPKNKKRTLKPRTLATLTAHKRQMRTMVNTCLQSDPVKARVAQMAETVLLFAMGHRIDLTEEVNAFTDLIFKEMPR